MTREDRERDLQAELDAHIAMAVADRMSRGESREDAERAARRELGNTLHITESTRSVWRWSLVERVLNDFRIAFRTLARTPRFAFAALICIAIGVGATTTIMSALDAILLRPLPYPNEAELVAMHVDRNSVYSRRSEISLHEMKRWRESKTLSGIGGWRESMQDLTGGEGTPERVVATQIAGNVFPMLGVRPLIGRSFDASEAIEGNNHVVILGYALWQRRYGADARVVGKDIEVNGKPYRVVGVMPRDFAFPETADMWMPLIVEDLPFDLLFYEGVVGRIRPGLHLSDVKAEFALFAAQIKEGKPQKARWMYDVVSLRDDLMGALRKPILVFQLSALLVLLIACANVAALQLARSAARTQDFTVRSAIGAGGGRLALHVLIECIALALPGGLLGIAVAAGGIRLVEKAFPDGVPSYIDLSLRPGIVVAAILATLLSAALFALPSALRVMRSRQKIPLDNSTRSGDRGTISQTRWRNALIGAEIAISLVLIIAAVLLVRTNRALVESLGFKPDPVLTVEVPVRPDLIQEDEPRIAFYENLTDRIRAMPGVASVSSVVLSAPLDGPANGFDFFRFEGQTKAPPSQRAVMHGVTPGFVQTMGLRILAGSDLSAKPTGVVETLVNEAFAKRYFGTLDVVGRTIGIEESSTRIVDGKLQDVESVSPRRIVGVIGNLRHERPPSEIAPAMYGYDRGYMVLTQTFLIRTTSGDPMRLAPLIRAAVHDLNPNVAIAKMQTERHIVARVFWREKLQRDVVTIFAALALILAISGVYGVLTYAVSQRTAEFGIRLAMGASAKQLAGLVLEEAARVAGVAIIIGVAVALTVMNLVRSWLYGVDAADVPTLLIASAAMLAIAMLSALLPALTASRLDPARAISST